MATSINIPRRLPLLLVTDNVLLPGSSMRIPVRTMRNMNMVKSRLLGRNTLSSTIIGVVPREPADQEEDVSSVHQIGTAAVVVQVTGTNWPQPAYTLLVTGLCRFRVDDLLQESPYPVARVTQLDKYATDDEVSDGNSDELALLTENFREQATKLVDMLDISIPVVAKLKRMLDSLPSQHLPDICTSIIKASYAEKVQVLDAVDLTERFKRTLPLVMRQIDGLKLLQKARKNNLDISTKSPVRSRISNKPPGFREFMKEDSEDDDGDDAKDLEKRIMSAKMPADAQKAAVKELKRLKKMPQQMPEHAMIRNYLELMVDLPWSKSTEDVLDISNARQHLDADHYGLDKVKKRIIEYLAVRQLKNSLKGPILCFVGPPGVGKTSIGRSVAQTLGRQFHRIALGGVCDQSDIRGHRRTYIGSMPGRIVQGLRLAAVNNPVFLLDEIDKLTKGIHGDPSAALLEVLDPEQNNTFTDHYLNVPFDLSQVLFIATANSVAGIPPPLLDRMELIELPGYTQEEKVHIASHHLMPKQLTEHGLTAAQLQIPDDSLKLIISKYTREAGVRTLERRIGAIGRAVAVRVAQTRTSASSATSEKRESVTDDEKIKRRKEEAIGDEALTMSFPPVLPIVIDEQAVEDILGPAMYESEVSERLSQPGVAVGLAWTALGGEIMYVEATLMDGEGKLTLTGQLGDVMKESANLARNWLRSNMKKLYKEDSDVHIHFPAGAVNKDGPSAGITIVTVLASLYSGRCVRSDTAMTGEITLRGSVLPVGGIKEKVMAAHRAGITRIILPKRNEKDLHEIPDNVKGDLSFHFVSHLDEVLQLAFDGGFSLTASGKPHNQLNSKL